MTRASSATNRPRVRRAGRSRSLACVVLLVAPVALLSGCATLRSWTGTGTRSVSAIDSTPRAPRVKVHITGLDQALRDNVLAHLELASEPCDAPRWRVHGVFERSDKEVRAALRALGHFQPHIKKRLHRGASCWEADYTIAPGPPVRVRSVTLRVTGPGHDDPVFSRLLANPPIAKGQVLDQGRYESLKQSLQSLAAAHGYFDGRFTVHRLRIDVPARSAVIALIYDTGPRYRLGPVTVHQHVLNANLMRRLLHLRAGEPYDAARLTAQSRVLNDSGYFSRVDVSPHLPQLRAPGRGTRTVPVDVTLAPRKRHSYSAGVGVATDTGPRLKLGYEDRRVNRAGHRWSTTASMSLVDQSLSSEYRIPLADPRSDWLSFQLGYQHESTATSQSRDARAAVQRTGTRFGNWLETQTVAATRDSFTVGSTQDTTVLVTPGISWQHTSADNPLRPHHGYSLFLQLRGASSLLFSDLSFLQLRTRGTGIVTLPWGDRLITRAELGITATSRFQAMPPDYRFFAGGDNSIRGYGYQQLGPKDSSGKVVGGRYLVVGSVEYDHPLTARWGIAAFTDAGNAFNNFSEGLRLGVGAGVRWQTPVGPLRLDVGVPLIAGTTLFRIHLRFGPEL